jgi:hypothetical protein
MTRRSVQWRSDCHRALSSFMFMLVLVAWCSTGQAEELSNFIRDLYGGNGIFLGVSPGSFNHSAHFASDSLTELSNLNRNVVGNVGLSTLTPSTSIFNFNILQGMPTETTSSLGPIFGERAETLGQGKLSIAFSAAHQNFTTLNGQSLNDIPIILTHQPIPGCTLATCPFLKDQVRLDINLELTRNVYAAYAEYGITDRWDVGIVLPVVQQTAQAASLATIINNSGTNVHRFDAQHPSTSFTGGTASGIGDLIVRTKYNFWQGSDFIPDMAIVGQVNIPTGDQKNLLGSGSTDVLAGVVLSKQIGRFAPHLDVGYQVASGGFDRNNLIYAAGADFAPSRDVTVAVDFLGRWYTGPGGYLNTSDFSIGVKWRPFGENVFMADFLFPINKGTGLRSDYVAFLAYQVTF